MPPTIDVIVPTFNGWDLTRRCLDHLLRQTVTHSVVVVDSASTDGTPERVRRAYPDVHVHALDDNRGFGAACNHAVAASRAECIVLLNNDVFVDETFLERLVRPLEEDPRVGSVAALLVRPDEPRIDSIGLSADTTLAGFPRLQGAPISAALEQEPELLGPSGGAAAYRRRAWAIVGGFDERIFLYQEDLDLALRLRQAGWETAAAADARGVHLGSATAKRRSSWQRRHAGFSRGYLLRRYGVFHSRAGLRTLVTEAIVVLGDAVVSRDVAALRGRLAGWRAGAGLTRRPLPARGIDPRLGLVESLRLRRGDYAVASERHAA